VKRRNVEAAREREAALLAQFHEPEQGQPIRHAA
jgi:hypothetical protein